MFQNLLSAVQTRITASDSHIQYMDEDWGQLDYYHESPPVKFPACLLDIEQTSWNKQGLYVQDGVIYLSIRIADIRIANTSRSAPTGQRTYASTLWYILSNIHRGLNGWRPQEYPQFGTLARISTQRIKRDDGIREYLVIYSCTCTDDSSKTLYYNIADPAVADHQFHTTPPTITLTPEQPQ